MNKFIKLYHLLFFILFLSSCDKFEWHNPYDPECPKELFTPSSPGATMEGNNVKLTWTQENDYISGFALFRSAEGESITNLTQTQKSTTQYIDANITPGKKYIYYVVAVAGTNKSDTVKAEIVPVIPVSVSTEAVTEVAATSAKVSGNISNAGGGTVTSRGICWSTTPNPTVNNSKTMEGTGIGQFVSALTNLLPSTTYYARAYGENSRGISYGSEVSFTTLGPPKLTTTAVTNITATSATSGGTITSDGGSPITAKGVVWSTSPNPTIALATKTDDGTGIGSFTSVLSNLTNNNKYYFRSYATNIIGTSYGEVFSFTTSTPLLPSLSQGLVAYYPFNGSANDESGNSNHGVVNGAVFTTGKNSVNNNAYFFNGVNSTIDLPNPFLNGAQVTQFTISTRVKVVSTANSPIIWGKDLFWGGVLFLIKPDNSLQFFWANSFSGNKFSDSYTRPNIISLGEWVDITFVFENSKSRFYVNGIAIQTNYSWRTEGEIELSISQLESVCNFQQDANTSKFGARYENGKYVSFLNGAIDFFRVYNRALTQEEITYLANN